MDNVVKELIGTAASYIRVFRYSETLREFSKRVGIDAARLSRIECANGEDPTKEEMLAILKARIEWKPEHRRVR